jgi:uncharacterized protein
MHISPKDVALLIAEAGGNLVGRTRLQKSGYILERAGLGYGFSFVYHHYGPYSEELSISTDYAVVLGDINEESKRTNWGGEYFVYSSKGQTQEKNKSREELLKLVNSVNAVQLELAATAIFLHEEGFNPPWEELSERKPDKATTENVEAAKSLCLKLAALELPTPLPKM